jgi:hypothetical protein
MRTRVEKCPSGLAVVVPEILAAQAGLHVGDTADLDSPMGGWSCGPPDRPRSPSYWPA